MCFFMAKGPRERKLLTMKKICIRYGENLETMPCHNIRNTWTLQSLLVCRLSKCFTCMLKLLFIIVTVIIQKHLMWRVYRLLMQFILFYLFECMLWQNVHTCDSNKAHWSETELRHKERERKTEREIFLFSLAQRTRLGHAVLWYTLSHPNHGNGYGTQCSLLSHYIRQNRVQHSTM